MLSENQVAELVELGEARGWASEMQAPSQAERQQLGIQVQTLGRAVLLMASRIPMMLFNRVVGLGLDGPIDPQTLKQIIQRYQDAGIASFALQPSPVVLTAQSQSVLEQCGFTRGDHWAKVYQAANSTVDVPTRFHIQAIDRSQAEVFCQVSRAGFGMPEALDPLLMGCIGKPGWQHYLAYDDQIPVAGGALFVQGGVGWLGIGSTHPDHRRQGAQGALMARRIRDAAALGCGWVVTETGEDLPQRPNPSYHNMIRTGFKLAYLRPNYLWKAG